MKRIPFTFFSRIVLLTASAVLGILSLAASSSGEEFVFAGGSIAAAMLANIFQVRKRHHDKLHPHDRTLHPHLRKPLNQTISP